MPDPNAELLSAFDGHEVAAVRAALEAGADPCSPIRGKLPTEWLLEQYSRSEQLAECLRLLFQRGAPLRDPRIAPVVLNDADAVRAAVRADPSLLTHRTTLVSTFAPLENATLLHVAAEYGHLAVARALVELGADVNARAGVDADGMDGHTPLFHTVNSSRNRSAPIMHLLVEAGADCEVRLKGLNWGKGFSWETTFFDVTPISFAQTGLFPQVHRKEDQTYENIRYLLKAAGRPVPPLGNVPNRYLKDGH